MAAQFDAVKEVTDAFTLLFKRRNWLLGAPTTAGIFLMTVVLALAMFITIGPEMIREATSSSQQPNISTAQIVAFAVALTVGIILSIAVSVFTQAWTFVAAEPVWLGQDPAWDRGFNRAAAKLVTLLAYTILLALMVFVSIITIVGPFIILFLCMYGVPYILFENKSATAAIGASFRLASENLAPSLILVLAFIVIYIVGLFATFMFGIIGVFLPFVGLIANLAFLWLYYAYIAVAVVRFYDILNAGSGQPPFPIVPETTV